MDGNPSSHLAPTSLSAEDSNPFQWMQQIVGGIGAPKKRQEAADVLPGVSSIELMATVY
jgi:hypothetical protein